MSLPNLNFDDWLAEKQIFFDAVCDDDDDDDGDSCQCNQNNEENKKKNSEIDASDAQLNSSSHNLTTAKNKRETKKQHSMTELTTTCNSIISEEVKTRALVNHVASYYADYVHLMNLDKFFRNDTVVLSIRQIKENEQCKFTSALNARWIVNG